MTRLFRAAAVVAIVLAPALGAAELRRVNLKVLGMD
jgi:hypothetical protein